MGYELDQFYLVRLIGGGSGFRYGLVNNKNESG